MLKLYGKMFCLALLGVLGLLPLLAAVPGYAKRLDAPKFSSAYTDSTKQCKGAEPVFTCAGYGGYKLILDIGGVFQSARIERATKPDYSLSIAERQSVGWNPKVEWRMADGKPFAVIVRVDENDENAEIPKKIGENLIVMGLQGYEHISDEIDAKTPQANEKAREIADKGFTEKGGVTQSDAASTGGKTAEEPDIHGFFFIKDKVPQGFADIDHLNLGGKGEYGAKANPPYYGNISLKSKTAKAYMLLKPTMDGKNFSFKTEAVAGVSYEFEGVFTRLDFTKEGKQPTEVGDSVETVLSGTLRKKKAGKIIAEGKVTYSWYLGD